MGIQTIFVLHTLLLLPLLLLLLLPLPLLLMSILVLLLLLLLFFLLLLLLFTTILILILTQPITNFSFARSIFNPYDTKHTLLWLYPLILRNYFLSSKPF